MVTAPYSFSYDTSGLSPIFGELENVRLSLDFPSFKAAQESSFPAGGESGHLQVAVRHPYKARLLYPAGVADGCYFFQGEWHVYTADVDPETPLLYALSDELQLRGPKFGCGMAQCGACTVLVQGKVRRSCVMQASAAKQQEVTTLEGLGTPEKPHAIQEAFIQEEAAQCDFCLSGVILTAKVLLDENS